jgi:hypothetical protein
MLGNELDAGVANIEFHGATTTFSTLGIDVLVFGRVSNCMETTTGSVDDKGGVVI